MDQSGDWQDQTLDDSGYKATNYSDDPKGTFRRVNANKYGKARKFAARDLKHARVVSSFRRKKGS